MFDFEHSPMWAWASHVFHIDNSIFMLIPDNLSSTHLTNSINFGIMTDLDQ